MMTGESHSYQEAEEDPFEAEETLSLSDLPITGGDSTQSDDSYSKYDDDDDFFEFFSEDFTAATRSTTVDKEIIFCGRIINAYGGESKKNDAKQSNSLNKKVNSYNTSRSDPKSGLPRDYSVGMMRSGTTKNRWYLFMFGMSSMKSPPEMELRDIKSRQIRRSLPATATFPAGGEVVARKSQGSRKLWLGKLLRSLGLGCGNSSKQQNDVVNSLLPWDY